MTQSPSKPDRDALLAAYLDGQLDDDSRALCERYLESSPEARQEMADLARVVRLVNALPRVTAPAGFRERLARRLRRQRPAGTEALASGFLALPIQVLVLLAMLVVAVLYLLGSLEEGSGTGLEPDPSQVPTEGAQPGDPATGAEPPSAARDGRRM
jgi:ferric-dicitrate binding protein FerR (iron transport regulator)